MRGPHHRVIKNQGVKGKNNKQKLRRNCDGSKHRQKIRAEGLNVITKTRGKGKEVEIQKQSRILSEFVLYRRSIFKTHSGKP